MEKILVVGAGPVGLVMAAELARRGIECRIVDKLKEPTTYCRALGITPRTLEVWEDMGIVREVIDAGVWLRGRRIQIGDSPVKDVMESLPELPYDRLCLPQPETERILTKHLNSFGIEIERGIVLTNLTQNKGLVTATLLHSDGSSEESSFRYVIGCDGAHSIVRKQAGIAFEGEMMPYDFMLADVKIDWTLPRGMVYQAVHPVKDAPPDFFLAVPLPEPQRYRISMLAPESKDRSNQGDDHGIQSEIAAPGLDGFQAIASRLVKEPVVLSDLRWSSIFRISMRIADRYREGNIFLAGDAAHIHPPTGGQGMNTGIQDAYNLAWKMALVMKNLANEDLLESYNAERREEGLNVIDRSVKATLNYGKEQPKPDRLGDTQLLVSYRNSPWIFSDHETNKDAPGLSAGDRAPDCNGLSRQGVGSTFRLFDLFKGTEHILLIHAKSNLQQALENLTPFVVNLQNEFGEDFGSSVRVIVVGHEPDIISPMPGITVVTDADNNFANVYTSKFDTAWLVRPDGYIGWCGSKFDSPTLGEYLQKCFIPLPVE